MTIHAIAISDEDQQKIHQALINLIETIGLIVENKSTKNPIVDTHIMADLTLMAISRLAEMVAEANRKYHVRLLDEGLGKAMSK